MYFKLDKTLNNMFITYQPDMQEEYKIFVLLAHLFILKIISADKTDSFFLK